MAVHLAVAGDVFDGVLFCAVVFSHEMSWIRSIQDKCVYFINSKINICTKAKKYVFKRI